MASVRSESEEPEKEDIDEATYQLERKRKGKMPAQPAKKKVRRANTTVIIQEPIQVPFGQKESEDEGLTEPEESSSGELYTMSEEIPNPNDNVSLVDEVESLERITYEKILVELDDELLAEMKTFEDPSLQTRYNQMDAKSKELKSGKMIHIPSLEEVSAKTTLFDYIERIGFGWILDIDTTEVPVNLAREFFTSFRFRVTTDLDEPSIRFRVFGIELEMSVTEWTVRMGICTLPQAISAEWRSRERGVPNRDISFDVQDAWKALTHNHSKQYQATKSKSFHFSNPILRLAQAYLGYNLLGQINSASTTTIAEIYLMTCIRDKKKLHLGFWTAYQCHLIATHPVRNLTLCHLLGAFIRNSLTIQYAPGTTLPDMCESPALFDLPFFVRTRIVYMREWSPVFYRVGSSAFPSRVSSVDAENKAEEDKEWKQQVGDMLTKLVKARRWHEKILEKQGEQIEELMRLVDKLATGYGEIRELQEYQLNPKGYEQMTGRSQPEQLEKKTAPNPVASEEKKEEQPEEKKKGPAPEKQEEEKKKEVRKKRKTGPNDQKDARGDSKRSQKK